MARFNFRQGIARRQEDGFNNPAFLQPSNGGSWIDLLVTPDPTVFLIAHNDIDYMVTENATIAKAWGPFTSGTDYWLYWDVDFLTGLLSRGYTTKIPTYSPNQPPGSYTVDQHWFDTNQKVMKVWTGSSWLEKIRCFAVKYQNGATLVHYPIGTQVALSGGPPVFAGPILFDPEGNPLQKFTRNRRGQFITTETALHSQYARISNFRVEAAIVQGEAQENIPIHTAVGYFDYNKLVLARNTVPDRPAFGLSSEEMSTGEVRSFITKGFVSNDIDWDWTGFPAGTPLFVGVAGELVTTPPSGLSIQQIATVVDRSTIFVNIHPLILFGDPAANLTQMLFDRDTGRYVAQGGPPGPPSPVSNTTFFTQTEVTPITNWTINHNLSTTELIAQIYDLSGSLVIPDQIQIVDINTVQVSFGAPQEGTIHIVLSI